MINKLRVGIIVDDTNQSFLTHSLYMKSLNSVNYTVKCLVVQKTFRTTSDSLLSKTLDFIKRRGAKCFFDRLCFAIVENIERLLVSRSLKYKEVFAKHSLAKFEVSKIYVNPIISKSGLVYYYSEEDIESIKKANLDVLIRGGSGILRGDILNVCRLGILSFHHADNNLNRGGPPGFWEVFNREASTGFIIQRLLSELDGGHVVFKGSIGTSFFYQLNLCRLYIKSSEFLHLFLEKLSINQATFEVLPKTPYSYLLYTTPTSYQTSTYLIKTLSFGIRKLIRKAMHKSYRWGVAYQFVEDWKDAVLWKSSVIKNPPYRFLADPFVITQKGQTVMFVEDYDYRTSRGMITAYDLKPNEHKEIGIALKEDFHLSYPFLIRTENNLFMVPESHENKDIRLYKCIDFPLKWELSQILMDGCSYTDSSVFFFKKKWWIFTNKDSSKLGEHNSELHIFYSDTLESNNWCSHPANPVIFDSKCARNGGLILSDDNIYRVHQKQGFDMYGESMGVSKIVELTTSSYKEEIVFKIPAKFMKNIKGAHTLSFDSGVLCFDFVKVEDYRR